MDTLITIEEALALDHPLFIDLRSPAEYREAHIPGAYNLPILENEERALIGTLYQKESPDLAVDKGFELVAPKLPELCRKVKELGRNRDIVLYCWRGGMRSQSLSQVLSILGTGHYRLLGGYKAYRKHVNEFFAKPFTQNIVLLNGLTGVGKTELLQRLAADGYPAIDLEGLANNRGSVFGYIGQENQPTQKHFEGLLFNECLKYRKFEFLAVECESRRIGRIILPAGFFKAMQEGLKVLIYDSMENRIKRLTETYTASFSSVNSEEICFALDKLKKRLGQEKVKNLKELIAEGNYHDVVHRLLVDYYDPMYRYPSGPSKEYSYSLDAGDPENTLAVLKEILAKERELDS